MTWMWKIISDTLIHEPDQRFSRNLPLSSLGLTFWASWTSADHILTRQAQLCSMTEARNGWPDIPMCSGFIYMQIYTACTVVSLSTDLSPSSQTWMQRFPIFSLEKYFLKKKKSKGAIRSGKLLTPLISCSLSFPWDRSHPSFLSRGVSSCVYSICG